MKIPGDLISAADYAVSFRRMEPVPEHPRRLLLLLHGWGSDESQLAALGAAVDGDTLVVLARGPRSAGDNAYGWYRVGLGDDEPQVVAEEMEESLAKLVEFTGQLRSHHDVTASHAVVAGFSQGGALAAAIALTAPSCVAGFAMVSGRILPEIESRFAPSAALKSVHALIVHGRDDETLPIQWAEDAEARLRRLGVACEMRLHDAGHESTRRMQADVAMWFNDGRRPWQHQAPPSLDP
jgi:phospholipase/carboxylesterase